jgi:hypothetical protein
MQKRYWNWKDSDKTLSLNNWLLGILEPGLYRGFDFLPMAGLTLRLNHETTGLVFTQNDGSESPKTGVVLSKQGVVIKESAPIDLIIEATLTQPRIDIISCTHEYSDEVVGGLTATYRVYSGVADANPVAPIPSDPNNEIILGQLYLPANCSNLNSSGVVYTKSIPPSLGNDALVLKNLATSEKTTFMRFWDAVEVGLNLFLKSGVKIRNKANDAWLDFLVRDESGSEVKIGLKNVKTPETDYDATNKIYVDSRLTNSIFIGEVKWLANLQSGGSFGVDGNGVGIYSNWAIADGRNLTSNLTDKFIFSTIDPTKINQTGGVATVTLTGNQSGIQQHKHGPGNLTMPNHIHFYHSTAGNTGTSGGVQEDNDGNGVDYVGIVSGVVDYDNNKQISGLTSDVVTKDAIDSHENLPPYIKLFAIQKTA